MDISNKLTKQIDEMRYLTTENTWRYRSILRYFYLEYEKMKHYLYKEEVFEELKKHHEFKEYTIEQCRQDLDALIFWRNLLAIQDTSKVSTVEEFKNKQFRYQLSEYSVEIERLTIRLENLHAESASLEPSLLERIKEELGKLPLIMDEDSKTVHNWWNNLSADFKRLNQNYQDYIRDLYSIKAEEMMKTKEFLIFKDKFIEYLRDFIKGLQNNGSAIEYILKSYHASDVITVLEKAIEYELSIPRLDTEISYELLKENFYSRWKNLEEWFLGSPNRESEASKMLDITNEIIRKITRYAAQISESRNSAANRKEEYKKLGKMFLNCKDINEAHKLSSFAFGIFHMKHIKANEIRETDSINSDIFAERSTIQKIKPRIRTYREKSRTAPIRNNEQKKKDMLQRIIALREEERKVMDQYIIENKIDFENLPTIPSHVRTTLLRWLSKGLNGTDYGSRTEDGRNYKVISPDSRHKKCILHCEDGDLEMPAFTIEFER